MSPPVSPWPQRPSFALDLHLTTRSHRQAIVVDMLNDALTTPPTMATITIMGSGRLGPTITALLGLAAAVLGARALVRTAGVL